MTLIKVLSMEIGSENCIDCDNENTSFLLYLQYEISKLFLLCKLIKGWQM